MSLSYSEREKKDKNRSKQTSLKHFDSYQLSLMTQDTSKFGFTTRKNTVKRIILFPILLQ